MVIEMVKIIGPSFEIERVDGIAMLKRIEAAGRTCYKSEWKITEDSHIGFIKMLLGIKPYPHESVLEHEKITVRIICDRGISHELVRHRLCSFSQESTRYINYTKDRYGGEITVIGPPPGMNGDQVAHWRHAVEVCEAMYFKLVKSGCSPQMARSVLPNSLKTEIVITANLREWRLIFRLRTSERAHPQMREIMVPMLAQFKKLIPIVFDDIGGMDKCPMCGGVLTLERDEAALEYDACLSCGERFYFEDALDHWDANRPKKKGMSK